MKIKTLRAIIIAIFFVVGINYADAQCTVPTANSSTTPPTSFDYETVKNGNWKNTDTWKNGQKPDTDPSGKKIKITHEVTIQNADLILKNGSIVYVNEGKLTIKNGNLKLDDAKNEKFLAHKSYIEISGNFQQKNNTVVHCQNVELSVGDKGDNSGSPLFAAGSSTTSADFQNDGGYRRLEDVCLIVTHDYDNIGTDELINVCAEIGIRNPLNNSNPTGNGSGNLSNYSSATSMKVYGSQFFLPNGNVQNSKLMTTCATGFKLLNGNFQNQSSSTWSGDSLCIWVTGLSNHDLQNSGTWNVTVTGLCINGQIQGTYQTSLPSENCSTISACFTDCCATTPVPVEWLDEKAIRLDAEKVLIEWATAMEINNNYFSIERSFDNQNFVEIGTEDGAGNSNLVQNYYFEDDKATAEVIYYRIKQTDFDGKYDYSNTLVVSAIQSQGLVLWPNPGINTVHVNTSGFHGIVSIEIVDLKGSKIHSEEGLADQGMDVDLSNVDEGFYLIQVTDANGHTLQSRLVVKR